MLEILKHLTSRYTTEFIVTKTALHWHEKYTYTKGMELKILKLLRAYSKCIVQSSCACVIYVVSLTVDF
jgi:hypothetical protein